MVVMMLTAVKIPEKPVRPTPRIHMSAPGPGEWMASVSGAYPNQPKLAAPLLVKNPADMSRNPPRYNQ